MMGEYTMADSPVDMDTRFVALPGYFSVLDASLFSLVDAAQRSTGISGDLFEVGAFFGRSAVVLGQLARPGERVVVADIFDQGGNDESTIPARIVREGELPTVDQFSANYLRFHSELPEIVVGPSTSLDPEELGRGSFRLIHLDGAHDYESVVHDLALTQALAMAGAIVAFDDICNVDFPGTGAAIWPEVAAGRLRPLIVGQKLYATWDLEHPVAEALTRLVQGRSGWEVESRRLGDFEALTIWELPSRDDSSWKGTSKRILRNWTPPAVYEGAKRVRDARKLR